MNRNNNFRNGTTMNDLRVPKPMSINIPNEDELTLNEEMESYLNNNNESNGHSIGFNLLESEEGQRRRHSVMEKLNQIAIEWALEVAASKGILFTIPPPPPNLNNTSHTNDPIRHNYLQEYEDAVYIARTAGGVQIKIFGSYRLGVHNCDSDIDALLVTPSYITRNDFFSSFCEKLRGRIGLDVESVTSIPEAYTPVVKFTIDSQAVDMIFVSIQYQGIPRDLDVLDLRWLRGLDDQSVRSLNGSRVAEWICRLVPDMKSFSTTLRIVKLWARRRGIYSNVLGFLGGVNYALMVGYVCQSYINSTPLTILRQFFRIMSRWQWPQPLTMRQNMVENINLKDSDGRYLQVWNPKFVYKDSLHIMPIITPAYPAMNSAYNVSQPQYRYIVEELTKGFTIVQTNLTDPITMIDKLFESPMPDFFDRHPRYIQIDISASNENDQRSWFGWVESRIRLFIVSLEQPPMMSCHPIANCFHRQLIVPVPIPLPEIVPVPVISIDNSVDPLMLPPNPGSSPSRHSESSPPLISPREKNTIIPTDISSSSSMVVTYISSFFIGLSFQDGLSFFDASFYIHDFVKKVNSWNLKKPEMLLKISSLDRSSIPSFVFETKAEPSNIKNCTPKAKVNKTNNNYNSSPSNNNNNISPINIQLAQVPEKKGKVNNHNNKIRKNDITSSPGTNGINDHHHSPSNGVRKANFSPTNARPPGLNNNIVTVVNNSSNDNSNDNDNNNSDNNISSI